jgi:uncharacterized membrane protein YoaK (UPF0700 family)
MLELLGQILCCLLLRLLEVDMVQLLAEAQLDSAVQVAVPVVVLVRGCLAVTATLHLLHHPKETTVEQVSILETSALEVVVGHLPLVLMEHQQRVVTVALEQHLQLLAQA